MHPSLFLALACRPPEDPSDTTAASPGAGDPDAAPAAAALDLLRAVSARPVIVNAARGTAGTLFLDVPAPAGAPIDAAYAFLETYADLYGFDAPREELWPRSDDDGHYRFVQRTSAERGGLPLFNSDFVVHVDSGRVYMTSGRWVPHLTATPPALTAEQALAAADLDLTSPQLAGAPRLGLYAVWSEVGPPVVHTVWRATLDGARADTGAHARWQVDLDAITGELVHLNDRTRESGDKDFDIMYAAHTDDSAFCWPIGSDTQDWFDADGALPDYSAALDHNDDGVQAFTHANSVYDWYYDTFGLCSYDGDDAEVEIVTHADVPNANAVGDCGTMNFSDDFMVADVLAHEYTHLVDANFGDLDSGGQPGALNESFADVMACMRDRDWTVGDGLPGGPIRDLSDPPRFGDPDHYDDYSSGAGVHVNAGIPNKAAYLATAGGEHHGYAVVGLGWEKAEQLYHFGHIGAVGGDASFRDTRDALVGTAMGWAVLSKHGFDFDDWCSVANAYAAVGVGVSVADSDCDGTYDGDDGDDDGDGTPDGSDVCPHISDPWQGDRDGDGLGDACDDDQDGDGDEDGDDNCPYVANASQADANQDGVGDACSDLDQDGILDASDNCPQNANWGQFDADGDHIGDICDSDDDGDGAPDASDNCPTEANADQAEQDGDGFGDACDNCPESWNPDQDHCACATDFIERAKCSGAFDPEEQLFVHPLDEVALPWVDVNDQVPFDDYTLELTVAGTSQPWVVIDQRGAVVARSRPALATTGATQEAVWTPALDYRYATDGARAPFATDYAIQFTPELRETNVSLQIEAKAR